MKLAIKGHPTRGKEVIEILEMLGGINELDLKGIEADSHYYVGNSINKIYRGLGICLYDYIIYSLEEFLEKFPYKVGDEVVYKTYGIHSKIKSMLWNVEKEQVFYRLESNKLFVATSDELKPLKKEIMEEKEPEPKAPILSNRYDYAEGKCGYVIPDGYEFDSIKQGFQTEIILRPIKSQYPKTYEECCYILDIDFIDNDAKGYKYEQLYNLQKLLICRDAYWKIAGEEMGLGKDWDSRYGCGEWGYWIGYSVIENKIDLQDSRILVNHILVFPTEEMRDAFYENFKELIEQCKELL